MRNVVAIAFVAALCGTALMAQFKPKTAAPPAQPAPAVVAQPMTVPPQPTQESARRIERAEAMKLVKAGKAVFVDVRGKDSYDAAHIKGALSIPENELIGRLKEIPPGRMIITYCA